MTKPFKAIKVILAIIIPIMVCMAVIIPSQPVYAIADPDTPPQASAVYVYSFSDGSVGVLIDYYLDYAVLPDETATEAYMAVFVDTDGTTQLKSVAPYTYVDSGYGRGLIWIPFTAAEVTTYSIDSASVADYRVWLIGNPTLAWAGDPPKTITTVDQWNTTGDMPTLLALRVLYYADVLELAWSLDLIEATADGSKLTSLGESYFLNVIPGLRTLAPACFADTTSDPDYIPVSYDTAFGATATSGTATVAGSPQTLSEGTDTVDTGATTGTIIVDLAQWTHGTITDDTGTMTGSPVTLYPGTNTLTVTAAGTFTTDLEVVDTSTTYADTVTGTGFDLTDLATAFGMSRWMLSGLVWMFVSIIACAAAYAGSKRASLGDTGGASKVVMILLAILIVGGMLLGLLHPLVVSFMIIAYGAFIGYILFFRSETLHKGFMFMMWMFVIVSVAGNIAASGQLGVTTTRLTASITATETDSIAVASTAGFDDAGTIIIGDEQILYSDTDATHFLDTTFNDIVRGSGGTEATEHASGDSVRTKASWMLNASIDYKIARITDSAGALSFIAAPARIFDLMLTFFALPLDFLGTELAVLSYLWMVIAAGMIIGFVIQLVGGRRV